MDRISTLPDELLHVILGFVGDALAVTRTAALSRRWRHVWVHAKSLTIDAAAPGRFVDWVLARRADQDMESLQIRISPLGRTSPEQANGWLRYAARRVVGSFALRFGDPGAALAVELPAGPVRATSIEMDLANRTLRLPPASAAAAAYYESLTELLLFSANFAVEEEDSGALGDLVTSCCPRLRTLRVVVAAGLPSLALRAEALDELEVSFASGLRTLNVTAPNLRLLKVKRCAAAQVVRIVAPRLEEIFMSSCARRPLPAMDIPQDCLASVRRLEGISVDMHGKYHRGSTYIGLWLMERCHGVEHVNVMLRHGQDYHGDELLDLTSEEAAAAPIVNATSMVVRPIEVPDRYLVASVSALLMRFPCLRSLRVKIYGTKRGQGTLWPECFCGDAAYSDKCEIRRKVALGLLEEVEITGFTGADEEMKLVGMLFQSSNSIRRMALRGDAIGRQHLMKVPSSDRGWWNFAEQVLNWTCNAPGSATLVDQMQSAPGRAVSEYARRRRLDAVSEPPPAGLLRTLVREERFRTCFVNN